MKFHTEQPALASVTTGGLRRITSTNMLITRGVKILKPKAPRDLWAPLFYRPQVVNLLVEILKVGNQRIVAGDGERRTHGNQERAELYRTGCA